MPKILKMPKPASEVKQTDHHGTGNGVPVSNTTPTVEIILFPNGRNEVPFVPGFPDDEALSTKRKKA